jgi:hypothetical protein
VPPATGAATVPTVTGTPLWAFLLVGIATPVLTAAAAVLAVVFTRKSAERATSVTERSTKELELRSLREQRWATLRWSAEMAASENPTEAAMGVANLKLHVHSQELNSEQRAFVRTSLYAVLEAPRQALKQLGPAKVYAGERTLEESAGTAEGEGD